MCYYWAGGLYITIIDWLILYVDVYMKYALPKEIYVYSESSAVPKMYQPGTAIQNMGI